MKLQSTLSVIVLATSITLFVGCGSRDELKLTEASGKVTQGGKPIVGAVVTFFPDSTKSTTGPTSTGMTDDSGGFVLSSGPTQKGAVIGHHKVTVAYPPRRSGMDPKAIAGATHGKLPKYIDDMNRTPLKADVEKGGKPLTIELPEK